MLQGGYQSVLEARSREEFRSEVIRFAQKLDFQTVSAITVVPPVTRALPLYPGAPAM